MTDDYIAPLIGEFDNLDYSLAGSVHAASFKQDDKTRPAKSSDQTANDGNEVRGDTDLTDFKIINTEVDNAESDDPILIDEASDQH